MLRWILALLFVFPLAGQAVSFTQYPTSTNTSGSFTLAWQSLPGDTQNFKVQELKAGVETRVVASSGTSVIVTGLSSGTYSYELWITRRYFNNQISEWVRETTKHDTISVVVSVTIPPPAKPTAPSLSNNGTYSVSWDAVTGASSYHLEEQINTGGWLEVQNSADRSKAYTGKADGTYAYRVRACIGGNCSGYSATATVQVTYPPASAPGITSNISQTTYSYTGNLSVAWNAVATATRYELEQLIGSTWTNKVRANQTSASLLNYELGSYSFRVRACNAGGCSGWSATKVISLAQAPNITGATTSRGAISLTWAQPGPANYVNVVENNVLIATFSPTLDGKTLTLNRPDGTYNYAMRSCIQIDGGTDNCKPYGLPHTVQVLTVPGIPASIAMPATSDNRSLAVSWGVATGTVHRYQLFQQLGSGSWQPVYSGTARAATATGLTDGSYRFQVRACNTLAGSEDCSTYRTSTTALAAAKPAVPAGITVPANSSSASLSISWLAEPSGNADEYRLQQQFNGGTWQNVFSGNVLNTNVNVNADGRYSFRVMACNTEQSFTSCSGETASASVIVAIAPGMPGVFSGVPTTSTSAAFNISWGQASGRVDRYELEQVAAGGGLTHLYDGPLLSNAVAIGADGSYTFRVRACNDEAGFSGCSTYRTSSATIVAAIPTTPGVPSHNTTGLGKLAINWGVLAKPVYYVLLQGRVNNGSWTAIGGNHSGTGIPPVNLTDGQWQFRMRLCNGYNWACSSYSPASSAAAVRSAPLAPTGLQLPDSSDGALLLNWLAADNKATYFQVFKRQGGGDWLPAAADVAIETAAISNLAVGNWEIAVKACNGFAWACSPYSSPVTHTVIAVPDWVRKSFDQPLLGNISNDTYTPLKPDIGAIRAEAGVSGGQASYRLAMPLPPGRAAMQPEVIINYHSQQGNGVMGVGFGLAAGEAISRCAATVAQDGVTANVSYTATDRLCLNGQRLMAVSGSYGAVNSQYRTEIDQFSRVTQLGGSLNESSTYFKVDYPNGRTAYFGSATNIAKVIHSGRSEAFSWLVDHILDATGKNAIHYNYDDLGSGEVLLNSIYYTGSSASVQGDRSVRFTYESRPDISQSYLATGLSMQTQRLKTISSYVGGDMTQQFSLAYKASGASSRSLLQSVQQCGYQQAQPVCYEPTEFSWQDTPIQYQLEQLKFDGVPVYQQHRTVDTLVPHGDINGDGVRDWPGHFVSAEGIVTGEHSFALNNCQKNPFTLRMECVEGDFDNNGLTDGWDVNAGKLRLLLTQPSMQQTIVNTNINLQSKQAFARYQDHVRHIADFNGDGWQDIVIYRYNSGHPQLQLYSHSGNVAMPYSEANKVLLYTFETAIQGSLRVETSSVQFIGDIDGNGLPDLAEAGTYTFDHGSVSPIPLVRKFLLNRSTLTITQFIPQAFIPFGNAAVPRYFSYFLDVNGDGLADWLGWADDNFTVQLRLNKGGGQFSDLIDLGVTVAVRRYRTHINGEWTVTAYPQYLSSFRVMDIDSDGKAELLIPGSRVAVACTMVKEATNAGVQDKEVCGDEMYLPVRMQPGSSNTSPLPTDQFDDSVYRFTALKFDVTAGGNITATEQLTDIYGSATENFATDAFGKGLTDMVFAYGPRFPETHIDSVNGAMAPFGHQYGLYINRNRGSATGAAPYAQPDVLKAVQDGFNVVHQWDYLPLSTAKATLRNTALSLDSADISAQNSSLAFYLPDRSYVEDGQHFHFASSMFAVAQFSSSDGLGGMSHTRYAYRGAMYHTQGRGFRGFRAIVTEDSNTGLINHTDFRQKFPFTGQVRGQFSFAGTDYPSAYPAFGYDAAQATQAANALSVQVYNWQQNPAHASAMGTSCTSQYRPETDETDLSCPAGAIVSLYLAGSDNYTYDLHSKQQYSHQRSRTSSIDAFGNVLQSSQTITDDSGVYASQTEATYVSQTSPWWPHRLQSQTRHSIPVQQQGTVLSYDSALDSASWVKTSYSDWHLSGAPQQVALSSSDNSRSQSVVTSFNDYGLPLSVTRTAEVMNAGGVWNSQSRTEQIRYSKNGTTEVADGYFPFKLTNALNHTSYLHTDAATGQPASQIDANGVTTTMTYDALGRAASMQRTGQAAQYSWYDSATHDSNAPAGAVWMQVVTQAGMPQQRSYYDQLGRALRKSIKGFAGDWINQDTEYNHRGLVVRQSGPYQAGSAGGETLFADYDILGRPGSKLLPGGLGIEYHYSGLNTDITANSSLQMRRSYNSLNKLLHTEDANGGHTYYRYNGQGLPIVLQDANGVQLTASYNALGQKLSVIDPNQGNSSYQYNGFGELEQETDANGLAIRFDYDVLGRQTTRTSYSGSTVKDSAAFSYDTAFKGLPYQESANGITRTFGYDGSGQLVSNMLALDGKGFTTRYFYDNSTGQPTGLRYPNGLTVQYGYTASGYLQQVSNLASGYVYRTITSQDGFGNTLSASLGNGTAQDNQYDSETGWVQSLTAWRGGTRVHDVECQQYDVYGNIRQVHNHVTGATESYDYDALHRLTNSTYSNMGYTVPISYDYDAVGNLQQKSDYANTYRYGNAQKSLGGNAGANAVRQVVKLNNSTVNFSYDNQGNLLSGDGLSISYNSFKQPTQITRGSNSFAFTYGANLERLKETRSGITTYEIDKLYEEESNGNWRIYLSDIAIIKYDATNQHQIRYTHKDRLGSTLTYTDHNGQVTDRRMFDAFGKPRAADGNTLTPPRLQNLALSRNGFTDHRHLDEVELIHMNGRAYDYNLGRFLSVDPLIQDAANSQSLNPYSYIINNPLSGTDPTGYARITGSRIDRDIKESDIIGDNITGVGGNVTFSGTFQGGGNGAPTAQQAQVSPQTPATDIGRQSGGCGRADSSGCNYTSGQRKNTQNVDIGGIVREEYPLSTITDFTPIVGDIKGIVEAVLDPSLLNITAAGVGLFPFYGDAASKAMKEAKHLRNASESVANSAQKALGHLRIGHTVPWADMTKAQRKAFQHSYSRHGAELGLPKWQQGDAEALRQQFNNVVGHIRETGTNLGTMMKPFNGKSTRVNYFESNLQGTKYYYYETMSGQFVSAGKAR
ncbi:RHS repeat-associated core domain-containing protein [Rheinheimera hassiensis]|uniref:RHS repeat-associated core domain-containing protein n=1 Tax=Rheinheimera hassiensis TaxID=1193627 RepID=UPI001F0623C9|nr:RHS repeat-associated core domain-containing protein [Rheinheimera hassiensis]